MSTPGDDPTAPKTTPTSIDAARPFDSVVRRGTVAESDPPTALIRQGNVRELPPGSVVDDTYEVDARLGAGAMGEVYAARHLKLGKRVAIKVISRRLSEDEAAMERFAMEARTLAQIQHPAIVAVEHVGELADGRAYFVMEFLRGETLLDRLARGRAPLDEALRIIDQMARGLEAAHQRGVTHRDLKPENVFLVHLPGEPPIVKLVDFGLAKLAADVAEVDLRAERTQSGVAIGTPMYMSPEQSRGPDVDHRTDIYALGCIAYELVLGSTPFPHARTAPEFWAAHLSETAPHPRSIWPEVPPQLDLALFAMLAKDPTLRPTLAQVRAVIATVTAALPERAGDRAPTMIVGEARTDSKLQWIFAAAVVAVLTLTLAGILVSTRLTSRTTEAKGSADTKQGTIAPVADAAPIPDVAPAIPVAEVPEPSHHKTSAKPSRPSPALSPAPAVSPIETRVGEPTESPRPRPIDRDQTINPFKHKVSP